MKDLILLVLVMKKSLEAQQEVNKTEREQLECDISSTDDLTCLFDALDGREFSPDVVTSDDYYDQLLVGAVLLAYADSRIDDLKKIYEAANKSVWTREDLVALHSRMADDGFPEEVVDATVIFMDSPPGVASFAALVAMAQAVAAHFQKSQTLDPSWLDCLESARIEWYRPVKRQEPERVVLQYRGLSSSTSDRTTNRGVSRTTRQMTSGCIRTGETLPESSTRAGDATNGSGTSWN